MNFLLQPAVDTDFDFLYQLNKTTMQHIVIKTYGAWDEALQRQEYINNFSLVNNFIVVSEKTAIGNFSFKETSSKIFIKNLQILPAYQGKGIGSSILNEALQTAKLKSKTLELRVYRINEKAEALYEKLGFIVVAETSTHFFMRYSSKLKR